MSAELPWMHGDTRGSEDCQQTQAVLLSLHRPETAAGSLPFPNFSSELALQN